MKEDNPSLLLLQVLFGELVLQPDQHRTYKLLA